MGRSLGDPDDPLLVSVRSGAKFSMPGMMETVLDLGLNDETVVGLGRASGSERFAFDSYRRLLQMFGATVLGIDASAFAIELDKLKAERGVYADVHLDVTDLRGLVSTYQAIIREHTGRDFPQDPREQVRAAVLAVFSSWLTERAVLYRRQERIPDDLGTAVNVQAMVFGNRGPGSGSGVCFTRDPASGAGGAYGDYLADAQGEDVVAGIRNTVPLADLQAHRQAVVRPAAGRHVPAWSGTTATCATSSSPSRAAVCGSCRRGSESALPRPRSGSPGPWWTRG